MITMAQLQVLADVFGYDCEIDGDRMLVNVFMDGYFLWAKALA
jgi:hypothetical protein